MARTAWRLTPISDAWDWQLQGRCRERGGTQFFHPDDDLGRISRRLRESAAKQLCQRCPVRKQCATHALKVGEEYGVWGGFSEHDRTLLRELGWQDAIDDDRLANLATLDTRLARLRRQQKAAREERERERAELAGAGAGSRRAS
jgi:WhiB family transcriptional regulator, redox-sensing transcriptional regulator